MRWRTAARTLRDQLIESASPERGSMASNLIPIFDSLPTPDTLHGQIISCCKILASGIAR
jgi:hypothetical protein